MTANVFSQDCRIGFKPQQVWGLPHALEFFFLGAGGGVYLLSTWVAPMPVGQLCAIVLTMVAGAVLVFDLGKPTRLWRSMGNLKTSWISRGALSVFLFLGAAFIALGVRLGIGALGENFALAGEVVASLFAVVVMLYPGLVLSSYASIPAWNTPMIPFLFFIYSWLTGLALVWLLQIIAGIEARLALAAGIVSLALTVLLLLVFLGAMARGSVAVRESYRQLTQGALANLFLGMVIGGGLLAPLLLVIGVAVWAANSSGVLAAAAALVLIGGFCFRYCVLKAGIYPPLF